MIKFGILDIPDGTRWSKSTVALMGGIAIFSSFLLTVISISFFNQLGRRVTIVLFGGAAIFLLGLQDDIFGTKPKVKLFCQLVVSSVVVTLGVSFELFSVRWLNNCITILWIVGLTNSINLIDNMDGLSSGITAIAASFLFILTYLNGNITVGLIDLAVIGSCLGFLRSNFSPAQIFMGDCGSMFLGYLLATLSILSTQAKDPFLSFAVVVMILALPIFDTTLVTILRSVNKRVPWQGGRDHSSHRLVSIAKGKEKFSVLLLFSIGCFTGVLGVFVSRLNSLPIAFLTLGFLFVGFLIFGIRLSKVDCGYNKIIE